MQQRDIIIDQIEQMGKAIGKLLSRFLDLKSEGLVLEGIEQSTQQLKERLGIDIQELLVLDKDNLVDYLYKRKLELPHFELLANHFKEVGKSLSLSDPSLAKCYLSKSLDLLELVDDLSQNLSLDRLDEKTTITHLLTSIK